MNEMEFQQGQYASFLVRLWRSIEPEPVGLRATWHGEIEHIQSGKQLAFASVSELCELLCQPLWAGEGWSEEIG
jgi:hypothetical protein